MDRAPALCIVGDLGVIRNAFSASLSRSTNGLLGNCPQRIPYSERIVGNSYLIGDYGLDTSCTCNV